MLLTSCRPSAASPPPVWAPLSLKDWGVRQVRGSPPTPNLSDPSPFEGFLSLYPVGFRSTENTPDYTEGVCPDEGR